jgi:antitoxin HicB
MTGLQFGVSRGSGYVEDVMVGEPAPMSGPVSYTIQLRPEPEGGFTVLVPALPEIVTYGADEEDALRMAHDAIELALAVRRDDGDEIPADIVPLTRTVSIAA